MLVRAKFIFIAFVAVTGLSVNASADETGSGQAERALVIVTSSALQTQGMALILANAMQQQGTALNILLCDAAGDLAIDGHTSSASIRTPPENPAGELTPESILQRLQDSGAQVDVCAIYLPNSAYGRGDLRDGIGIAAPRAIAELMRDVSIPVFSF